MVQCQLCFGSGKRGTHGDLSRNCIKCNGAGYLRAVDAGVGMPVPGTVPPQMGPPGTVPPQMGPPGTVPPQMIPPSTVPPQMGPPGTVPPQGPPAYIPPSV